MKADNKFKKHHFWFLAGAVPLLIGIVFILLLTEPADAIETNGKNYDSGLKGVKDSKPPGIGVLKDLDKQKTELEQKRDERWQSNYERQKAAGVYNLPISKKDASFQAVLKAFEARDLRFGAKNVNVLDPAVPADRQYTDPNDMIGKFTDEKNYFDSYKTLAESIAPCVFEQNNWQGVLRFVSKWVNRRAYDQFWLAAEDYWVQKALLAPIAQVNAAAAEFKPVEPPKDADDKLHRAFQSRLWDLEIRVDGKTLKSKLKNRSERLQLLGTGKNMKLLVWIGDPAHSQPFEYKIEGEYVRGGEELTPRFVAALHTLPADANVEKIWKVEQVFDITTAPVRIVRRIDLGYTDSRRPGAELKPPKFMEDEPLPGAALPPGVPPPPPPPRGPEGGAPAATPGAKTGTNDEVLLGNKKRYLEVNDQIRRMPVAISIVVDQAFVKDLVVAYANSPLRFLTTQVQMQRFRETLPLPAGTIAPTGGPPTALNPPIPGRPMGDSAVGASTVGPLTGSAVADSQATAGLTELAIYGIVTFYEKYAPKPPAGSVPPKAGTPAPPAPAPNTGTPTTAPSPAPNPAPTTKPAG